MECKEELLCTGAMVSEGYVPTARSFRSRAAPLLPLHDWQVGPSIYTTNYMLHVSHYSYKNHTHILSHSLQELLRLKSDKYHTFANTEREAKNTNLGE